MIETVQQGEVVEFGLYALGLDGNPATGRTDLVVRVRRGDGLWLDFGDQTFKAAGWTTRDASLVEADAALAPGVYTLPGGIDTSDAAAADALVVYPLQALAADAVLPAPGEIKVGGRAALQLTRTWQRLHLDPDNERVDTPDSIKVPADGSLIDIDLVTVGTTITGTNTA